MKINIFDEMVSFERKLGDENNLPDFLFDSSFFNKMEQIFSVGDYYYVVVNLISFEVEFVHNNVEKILGYPIEIGRAHV